MISPATRIGKTVSHYPILGKLGGGVTGAGLWATLTIQLLCRDGARWKPESFENHPAFSVAKTWSSVSMPPSSGWETASLIKREFPHAGLKHEPSKRVAQSTDWRRPSGDVIVYRARATFDESRKVGAERPAIGCKRDCRLRVKTRQNVD